MKSTNVTSGHIDKWETSERDGNITATSVAVRVSAKSPREVEVVVSLCLSLSSGIFVLAAVWAVACGLEHKTPLSSTRICECFVSATGFLSCRCVGGSSMRILPSLVRPSATVAIIGFVCWWAGTRITRLLFLCKLLRRKIHTSTETIDLHEDAATTAPWRLDDGCETKAE